MTDRATPPFFILTLLDGGTVHVEAPSSSRLWAILASDETLLDVDGAPVLAHLVRSVRPAAAAEHRQRA